MEKKFYNCSNNVVFKEVMLKKENEDILKEWLETIVEDKINSFKVKLHDEEPKDGLYLKSLLYIEAKTDKQTIEIGVIIGDINRINLESAIFYGHDTSYYCNNHSAKKFCVKLSYNMNSYKDVKQYPVLGSYIPVIEKYDIKIENVILKEYNVDKLLEIWKDKDKEQIKEFEMVLMLLLPKEDLEILSKNNKTIEKYKNELIKFNDSDKIEKYLNNNEF